MKTNRLLSAIGLLSAAILFMGCPYSSSFPLSEPSMKVPENLIGTWELSGGSEGDMIEVRRTGTNTVDIIKTSGYDGTTETYGGHFTDINGELFLNLKETGDYGSYYFYKVRRDGDFKVTILPVTTYIRETFETSEQMKKYFADNMKNSYFFTTEEETYYKIK